MDVNAFTTTQVQGNVSKNAGQAQAAGLNKGSGLFGMTGVSFMDLMFSQLSGNDDGTDGASVSPLFTNNAQQTSLSSDALSTGLDAISLNTETPDFDSVRAEFLSLLQSFLQGTPSTQQDTAAATDGSGDETGEGADGSDLLTALENGESDDVSPLLIATGLTPEDLQAFMDKLRKGLESGESYVVGLIKLLPPQAKNDAIILPRGLISGQNAANSAQTAANDTDGSLASQLNSLLVGEEGGEKSGAAQSFDSLLRILEKAQGQDGNGQGTDGLNKALNALKKVSAGLSAFQGTENSGNSKATELFLDNEAWDQVFPDGLPWDLDGALTTQNGGGSLKLSGPISLTSVSAYAGHATTAHPTTQTVAATLQKAAGSGESKSFTLKLDPPELGRLDVEMEFSDDKTMKARLVIEKPETYMMLQRDAHVLERALQNAGLDVGDGGLSFELAQDGSMTGQDDNSGNNGEAYNGATGGTTADGEEIEIIETSMDLYVDPETGLTRYDILA